MKCDEVADVQMKSPGKTKTLSLADHQQLESSVSATNSIAPYSARLADFQAHRDKYWAAHPPPHPHRRSSRSSRNPQENGSRSGARYEVSQDGCWVMEVFANAADMCFVTNRYIFNLWTYEQLRECDMLPWVSLNPPTQQQDYDEWEPDERSQLSSGSAENPSDQFVAMSSPNLHHNVGCHDESDDDDPQPDYHSGCGKVTFRTCHIDQANGLSQELQVIRASRFANSFDRLGRHWVYVLPSSPLEPVLSKGLKLKLPHPVIQRIWSLAVSWPAHNVDGESDKSQIVTMKINQNWPFNMLRVRRYDRIVERSSSLTSDIVAIIPQTVFEDVKLSIDQDKSSGDFWKLAVGTKRHFVDRGFLVEDYHEGTEGFITKSYHQEGTPGTHDTLTR